MIDRPQSHPLPACTGRAAASACSGRTAAFTLAELVVSVGILSIVVVACGSVIMLSARAMTISESADHPAAQTAAARTALSQLSADLRLATAVVSRSSRDITLTLPDRTGDGLPETVRYAWSGVAGAPLTRQYTTATSVAVTAAPAITIASPVYAFNLDYVERTLGTAAKTLVESGEQLLIGHDDAAGGSFATYSSMSLTDWPAQYFKPALSSAAVSYKITKVSIVASRSGTVSGTMAIEVRPSTSEMKPAASVTSTATLAETALGTSMGWKDVAITTGELDPTSGYCLVIKQTVGTNAAAAIQYESGGAPMTANAHFMTGTASGTLWSAPAATQDMRFRVYGKVTTLE